MSVAIAAPAAGSKYKKLIEPFAASLETAKTLMDKAHSEFVDFEGLSAPRRGRKTRTWVICVRSQPWSWHTGGLWPSTLNCASGSSQPKSLIALSMSQSLLRRQRQPVHLRKLEKALHKSSPSKSPSKLQKEHEKEDPHPSSDKVTLHMVSSLKCLPPKYWPSKEHSKYFSWEELKDTVAQMLQAETIEELDSLKKMGRWLFVGSPSQGSVS